MVRKVVRSKVAQAIAVLAIIALSLQMVVFNSSASNFDGDIIIEEMSIQIDGEYVYLYNEGVDTLVERDTIYLESNSSVSVNLKWKVNPRARTFREGERFQFEILDTMGLPLNGFNNPPAPLYVEVEGDDTPLDVGTGQFYSDGGHLYFDIVFNETFPYLVISGQASAGGNFSLGEWGVEGEFTYNGDESVGSDYIYWPPAVTTPEFPDEVTRPGFQKRLVSPGATVNGELMPTQKQQVGDDAERLRYGFEWAVDLDMGPTYAEETATPKCVVVRDTISSNMEFSNYKYNDGDTENPNPFIIPYGDWELANILGWTDKEAPFYVEVPMYTLAGYPIDDSSTKYIVSPAKFKRVTEENSEKTVESTPLSYAIIKNADGTETLIINLGYMYSSYTDSMGGMIQSTGTESRPVRRLGGALLDKALAYLDYYHRANDAQEKAKAASYFEDCVKTLVFYWPEAENIIINAYPIAGIDLRNYITEGLLPAMLGGSGTYTDFESIAGYLRNDSRLWSNMRITGATLHYRTVLEDLSAPYEVKNYVSVKSDWIDDEKELVYDHWYRMNVEVELDRGDVGIIKTSGDGGMSLATKSEFYDKDGLAGATFLVLKNGKPVAFNRNDSAVYTYNASGSFGTSANPLVTDENGRLSLKGLPVGPYTLKEISAPKGYVLLTEVFPFTVSDTVETYINVTNAVDSLEVSKKVQGLANSQDAFEFHIAFSGNGDYTYTIDGKKGTIVGGAGLFSLKDGQAAVFGNIPAGTTYTVTEVAVKGYAPNFTDGKTTGVVTANQVEKVEYVNTYTGTTPILYLSKVLKDDSGKLIGNGTVFKVQILDKNENAVGVYDLKANGERVAVTGLVPGEKYFLREHTGEYYTFAGFEIDGVTVTDKNYLAFTMGGTRDAHVILNNVSTEEYVTIIDEDPPLVNWPDINLGDDPITIPIEDSNTPLTGDNSSLVLPAVIMLGGAAAAVLMLLMRRRRTKRAK